MIAENALSREKAAHRKQALATIGQKLRQEYDVAQPMPDRLSDLVKEIEQSTSESRVEQA